MDKSLRRFGREMSRIMPQFMREILKRQARALSAGNITIPQMIILTILNEKANLTMSDIARALSITTSAATGLADRMIKSGLIKRARDKKDRRVVKIEINPKGRKIIDNIQKERHKVMMDMFSKLSPAERNSYLSTVKKIYRILRETNK